ncbi:hypothetical protein BJV74DRAFT_463970 [Russula compacta]|nr:hypothetical protein BJV74DRAFT_463970 [Russula compacta]
MESAPTNHDIDLNQPPPHASTFSPPPFPSPIYDLPSFPSPSLPAGVQIHPALAVPNLLYDMRYQPSQSNPALSSAILSAPATNPPLPSLELRIGGLPWILSVRPDGGLSSRSGYVTVQDVLLAIYFHLRPAVTASEYNATSKSKKMEIIRAFERRVAADRSQRNRGVRRADFLGGRFHALGLAHAQSTDNVLDVVIH